MKLDWFTVNSVPIGENSANGYLDVDPRWAISMKRCFFETQNSSSFSCSHIRLFIISIQSLVVAMKRIELEKSFSVGVPRRHRFRNSCSNDSHQVLFEWVFLVAPQLILGRISLSASVHCHCKVDWGSFGNRTSYTARCSRSPRGPAVINLYFMLIDLSLPHRIIFAT